MNLATESATTTNPPPSAKPEIPRRDLKFDLDAVEMKSWHPDGLHVSHFFNALSIFFPEGESFFIDAVRHYADRIESPELKRELAGFLGQEAMHSREHRRYNRALAKAGLPAVELERSLTKFLDFLRERLPHAHQLAITIALEHYTAILAHTLLDLEGVVDDADPRMSAVWRWHAIEETEHKAVAFDVYKEVMGDGVRSYTLRAGTMILTSAIFWSLVFAYHFRLVRAEGKATDLSGWGKLGRFLFVSPGSLRKIVVPWLDYFRPSFHPWDHDNAALVGAWKKAYAELGRPPV